MSTLSGKKTLSEIDHALGLARGNLTSVDKQYAGARSALARLRQEEVSLYAALARLRLVAIEQNALLDVLVEADDKAQSILAERKASLAQLERTIESEEAALAEDEVCRHAQQADVAAASEALDAAQAAAQAALTADAGYQAQLAVTEQADFVADQAEDKAAAARRDRIEKGKPYEADALFSYLWSRGYGTSAYRAWPLTRWLDGRVAKTCNYEDARRNYALLTQIPVRLDEHAAAMRAVFDSEVAALGALEQVAGENAGVPALGERLESERDALRVIDEEIAAREDRIRTLIGERRRYATGEDDASVRCVEVLSQAMQRESMRMLAQRAARTQDREDDEIVRRLSDLEREADRVERNLGEFRKLHDVERSRLETLEDVRRKFKAKDFDSTHSEFLEGALIALVLRQFLGGSVGAGDLWKTIERQQRTRQIQADPNFGSLKFPRSGGSGRWRGPTGGMGGGGFGGGGFRGGGGFGGGGFKTGGGF